MRDLHADAGGVFDLEVIRPSSDPTPETAVAVLQWCRAVISGQLDPLCCTCPAELGLSDKPPNAFIKTTPHRPDPSMTCITAFCESCARRSDDELMDAVAQWMRGRRLPSAHMHQTGGRA